MLAKYHTTRLYPDILLGFLSQVKKTFFIILFSRSQTVSCGGNFDGQNDCENSELVLNGCGLQTHISGVF